MYGCLRVNVWLFRVQRVHFENEGQIYDKMTNKN